MKPIKRPEHARKELYGRKETFTIDLNDLGGWVLYFRLKQGITQKQLADKAGIDPSSVSRIEAGSRTMSIQMVQKLLDELSVFPMLQEDLNCQVVDYNLGN